MHIIDSDFKKFIKSSHTITGGNVYVFENLLLSEFDEGAIINFDTFLDLYNLLDHYSKGKSSFGYISNRTNSYSVKAADFFEASKLANVKYPMAVVAYSEEGRNNFLFEKQIFKCHAQLFPDLSSAFSWLTPLEVA